MSAATLTSADEPAYDLVPEDLPRPVSRPRVLLIGTSFAAAAITVYFAGLIGIYLSARQAVVSAGEVWLADGNPVPLTPANLAMGTMLLSCVTMAWAVDAVSRNDRTGAYFALAMTVLFGAAVINATAFLYTQTGLPIAGEANAAGLLFYAVTGSHIALIVGALVYVAVMTIRTLGGEYGGRDREGIVAASLIWYLTTALFAVIWYAVYVTK